jgi:DNA-binding beta-propeller fold protein YncE
VNYSRFTAAGEGPSYHSNVSARPLSAIAVLLSVCAAHGASLHSRHIDQGIAVDLTVAPIAGSVLREGAPARVTVKLTDATTGAPLRGAAPAAWFSARDDAPPAGRTECEAKIASFLGGNLFSTPALDLNVYDVVTLNEDRTLSVVDPRFSFGGSRLLALVELRGRGHDWALSGTDRLFVTMPDANLVATVDTTSWKVIANLDAGLTPKRVAAQPKSDTIWVAAATTLSQIGGRDAVVKKRIPIPAGEHDLAFSADGRFLIVTSSESKVATIVETGGKTSAIPLPSAPQAVAFSSASEMAYVLGDDGRITIIDPKTRRIRAMVQAEAGATRIRFAPGGRYAFIVNTPKDLIQIFDAASGQLVQRGKFDGGPFEVTFTQNLAYVRHLRSDVVLMVPLADLKEGKAISVVDFPAGQKSFGDAGSPTPADGIVEAPESGAVLVAHPADGSIYYYKEGMAAPMGTFSNYGHAPRAVLVIDRTLRERSPGVFSTVTRLPDSGSYDAAVFVNSPRVVTCFDVAVREDPKRAAERLAGVTVEPLLDRRTFTAGSEVKLTFRLTDRASGKPLQGLPDGQIVAFRAAGGWTRHQPLTEIGNGRYETTVVPTQPGIYYVYVVSASANLKANNGQFLALEVAAP